MLQNFSKLLLLLVLAGLTTAFVIVITTTVVTAKAQTDEFNVYKFDNDGNITD